MSRWSAPRFTQNANEDLRSLVFLTNEEGRHINLFPSNNGLHPSEPLNEGIYTIRLASGRHKTKQIKFRVSRDIPIPKLNTPIDFHWNLKVFDYPLGYVYNTCFKQEPCHQHFITAQFDTKPLAPKQTFAYYEVGFISRFGPHSKQAPFESTIETQGLIQSKGTPVFNHRWGLSDPVDKCLGVMVRDGYGQSLGPIYSCRPRKYIKGSILEHTSWQAKRENWEEIEDWVYYDR
ncbi:hypothetical protein QWI17_16805 [Gilvimarinus sp. SDUM040013]|uniref:Uncharacterized protein n=1 Tax=Gilvimarinus gilvus TaxID=3058038 RepID=A0ABU4S6Z7_9GAMM|nr:hypothetical protein [Gilvimarinus sp. SDUM040013]MDO3387505.1 hypothetical protein [Gilvimarinus sp. SDUM040013]MDX6851349.1 hypothetical protein [Gilvimarinus sp. SDUM040013]